MNNFDSFEIAMLIREIYSSTMNIIGNSLKNSGLTNQQIMVIKLIAHNGEVDISKICKEMSLTKGTVSGIVQRLEAAGYVEKVKRDEDKRNTYIKFSEMGQKFAKEFRNEINESFNKAFENFTEEEIIKVKEDLKKLKNKIKDEY